MRTEGEEVKNPRILKEKSYMDGPLGLGRIRRFSRSLELEDVTQKWSIDCLRPVYIKHGVLRRAKLLAKKIKGFWRHMSKRRKIMPQNIVCKNG